MVASLAAVSLRPRPRKMMIAAETAIEMLRKRVPGTNEPVISSTYPRTLGPTNPPRFPTVKKSESDHHW